MEALYLIIKKDLLEKITSGVYPEGTTIPTELELSVLYEVSRPTVRQAVQLLVDEGYLEKRKRRGTIVCIPKIQQEFTQFIASFETEMSRKGLLSKTKVIMFKKEEANEEIAHKLLLDAHKEVYKLVRLRYVDEHPNVLVTTYIPCYIFPDLLSVDFTNCSLYDTFEREGRAIATIKRRLETMKADETMADLLDIQSGDPLFYFHSIGFDNRRTPVEYSISKYRGDVNSFVFELNNKRG